MLNGWDERSSRCVVAYYTMGSAARVVPTIIFYGTSDYTVNLINGDQVIQQWMQTDHFASCVSPGLHVHSPLGVQPH